MLVNNEENDIFNDGSNGARCDIMERRHGKRSFPASVSFIDYPSVVKPITGNTNVIKHKR